MFLLCFTSVTYAQIEKRQTINGFVKSNSNLDVQGVTVYNLTSKKGTITTKDGAFKIDVAVNDVLDISSLVFKDFKLTITPEDIKNKVVTAFLVEMVNNLDEVLILRGDLTGILDYDVSQVNVFNTTIDIDLGSIDMSNYEFSADYKTAAENIVTRQGQFYNMADATAIVKLVAGLFKNKKKKKEKKSPFPSIAANKTVTLQDKYKPEFYTTNFNIPAEQVQSFLVFAEDENFDKNLLNSTNEINLIEYLSLKSKDYLAEKR